MKEIVVKIHILNLINCNISRIPGKNIIIGIKMKIILFPTFVKYHEKLYCNALHTSFTIKLKFY